MYELLLKNDERKKGRERGRSVGYRKEEGEFVRFELIRFELWSHWTFGDL